MPLAAGASGFLAIFAANLFTPRFLSADAIMLPVMSLQHVTLFYWGQNRYANIIPFSLSWIHNPDANLAAHLFLMWFSFFALICLLGLAGTAVLFPEAQRRDRWTATVLLMAITLSALSPYTVYVLVVEQPYGASYLLLGIAALQLAEPISRVRRLAAVSCLFLASGLNPSILLPALVLSAWLLVFNGRRNAAIFLLIASVSAAVIWAVVSHTVPSFPVPYFGFQFRGLGTAMAATAATMISALRPDFIAIVCVAVVSAALATLTSLQRASSPLFGFAMLTLLLSALAWWLLFSANPWVQLNKYHFRYFFPVLLIIPAAITLQFAAYLFPRPQRVKDMVTVASVGFIAACLIRPIVQFGSYGVFVQVAPYVQYAREHEVRFVAGDYWQVWPTVFRLLDQPGGEFGLAERGTGNVVRTRNAFYAEIAHAGSAKALCLGEDRQLCLKDANFLTGKSWQLTEEVCPGACSIIQTEPAEMVLQPLKR